MRPTVSPASPVGDRPTDRLFFALFPDAATALRIAALASRLRAQLGLKGRPHDIARFHITLHHVGDFIGLPQREKALACAAAAAVKFAPFEFALDHRLSFGRKQRNRPFVLGGGTAAEPVRELQRALGRELKRAGLRVDASFTPHLTLLYDDALVERQPLDAPIGWRATEFRLMDSLLGRHRHETLARWPLQNDIEE